MRSALRAPQRPIVGPVDSDCQRVFSFFHGRNGACATTHRTRLRGTPLSHFQRTLPREVVEVAVLALKLMLLDGSKVMATLMETATFVGPTTTLGLKWRVPLVPAAKVPKS